MKTTLTVSVAFTEIEVEVEFTCSPFVPEQGPTYASGGQPAEGGELEVTSATVLDGKVRHPAPWLTDIIQDDDDLSDRLRQFAAEDEDDDSDRRYEQMRDEAA